MLPSINLPDVLEDKFIIIFTLILPLLLSIKLINTPIFLILIKIVKADTKQDI